MIIVEPSATLESVTPDALELIERAGRVCWKSEDKIGPGSAEKFIRGTLMKKQHYSVLEHAHATFRFVTDRGVTHEAVRHRIAAFSQESTRYVCYGKEKFGGQINVIEPPWDQENSRGVWLEIMKKCEDGYLALIANGEKPQIARSVLPTCLKTEIVMTCNFREWLHVFDLRTSPAAHPQIVQIMRIAQGIMQEKFPCIFTPMPKEELEEVPLKDMQLAPGSQVFDIAELHYLRALLTGNAASAGVTKYVVASVQRKLAA